MNLSFFDFSVPAELIAKHPLKNRDGCRLLVLDKKTSQMAHRQFSDILEYLQSGDVLVLNDARVNKSRFFATRPTGGKVEVLLYRPVRDFVEATSLSRAESRGLCLSSLSLRRRGTEGEVVGAGFKPAHSPLHPVEREHRGEVWEAIISHSARVKEGEFLTLIPPTNGNVGAIHELPLQNGPIPPPRVREGLPGPSSVLGQGSGERSGFHILSKQNNRAHVQIESQTDIFEKYGTVPIPPYLERPAEKEDEENYQTVFARTPGASAAPTAGLHFTPELLEKIKAKGVEIAYLSLLVGPGTFEPIRNDDITRHKMHKEYFEIGEETCAKVNAAKRAGKKIWAVGTTVVKALETAIRVGAGSPRPGVEGLHPFSGDSELFIYPPFDFRIVDGLITNFHWPRSTLILLAAAFAGKDRILSAYNEAISNRYRFFSYGDAMLIY